MKKHPVQTANKQKMPAQPGQPAQPVKGDFKVLVDPQLKKGQQKLVRYNGETYSSEVVFLRHVSFSCYSKLVRDFTSFTEPWSRSCHCPRPTATHAKVVFKKREDRPPRAQIQG